LCKALRQVGALGCRLSAIGMLFTSSRSLSSGDRVRIADEERESRTLDYLLAASQGGPDRVGQIHRRLDHAAHSSSRRCWRLVFLRRLAMNLNSGLLDHGSSGRLPRVAGGSVSAILVYSGLSWRCRRWPEPREDCHGCFADAPGSYGVFVRPRMGALLDPEIWLGGSLNISAHSC